LRDVREERKKIKEVFLKVSFKQMFFDSFDVYDVKNKIKKI